MHHKDAQMLPLYWTADKVGDIKAETSNSNCQETLAGPIFNFFFNLAVPF